MFLKKFIAFYVTIKLDKSLVYSLNKEKIHVIFHVQELFFFLTFSLKVMISPFLVYNKPFA